MYKETVKETKLLVAYTDNTGLGGSAAKAAFKDAVKESGLPVVYTNLSSQVLNQLDRVESFRYDKSLLEATLKFDGRFFAAVVIKLEDNCVAGWTALYTVFDKHLGTSSDKIKETLKETGTSAVQYVAAK